MIYKDFLSSRQIVLDKNFTDPAYENKHCPIHAASPIDAIKFRMEQQSLTPKDLETYIGPSGRVSEVLNGKRSLSLRMIKNLHHGLNIPYESLLSTAGEHH